MRRFRQLALGLVLFSMAGHSWGDCIEGDCFNGQVKETYIFFGKVYEGDFKDGQRTGKGKYTWASGDVYEGDFKDGQITGQGK